MLKDLLLKTLLRSLQLFFFVMKVAGGRLYLDATLGGSAQHQEEGDVDSWPGGKLVFQVWF